MRNFKSLTLISILLLLFSCYEHDNINEIPDVEKAKNWFTANEANLSRLTTNPSSRGFSSFKKIPDWEKSKVHISKSGLKSVEVFLNYDTYLLLSEKELKSTKVNSINSMLLFEIEPGDYKVYLFKIYPDDHNANLSKNDFEKLNYGKIPKTFSGRMMVFDWDENFVGGWRIENGLQSKFIGRVNKGNNPSSNGRISKNSTISCTQIITYWYSQACIPGGGCAPPILIDVSYTVECEYSLAPGDDSGSQGPGDPTANTCFVQHTFIQGLMLPCSDQAQCENGYVRDWNGNCVCPSSMETINGNCTFRCLTGHRRNDAGNCVPIQNRNTNDQVLNGIQNQLDALWKSSNATHTSMLMANRLESGGWIVNGTNGYSIVPFPSNWLRTACGIDGVINQNEIPSNIVGMVHTHPFYVGEDTRGVCGIKGEEAYKGGPSRDDYDALLTIMSRVGNFTMKSYVIDGTQISSVSLSGSSSLIKFTRCGY